MKIKTKVKAGGTQLQHNESRAGLPVRSRVTAGRIALNHNQTQPRE